MYLTNPVFVGIIDKGKNPGDKCMSLIAITNAAVVLPDVLAEDFAVALSDGKIIDICPSGELKGDFERTVDAGESYLIPGLIDLHIHGSGDYLIDNGPADLAELCKLLPKYGVTSFAPTVCPRPSGEDADFLASLSTVKSQGSEILCFHMEGPFLTQTGALPPEALGTADPDRVRALIEAGKPYKVIFSIAPGFEGIEELLPIMTANGKIPAFITHTTANVSQTQAAIELGVRHGTHFYDVFYSPEMTEPGARPCGAVEALLADERCSVDFILDGEHVDPIAVKMALRCKGPDRVCLITDANIGAGKPPGRYQFGAEEVEFAYPGGPARLTEKSRFPGALAGSGLTMDLAVRNAVKMLDVDIPQAIRMASANPAQVLGLENIKGKIQENFDADFVLLDKNLNVEQTWINGKCVFNKDK